MEGLVADILNQSSHQWKGREGAGYALLIHRVPQHCALVAQTPLSIYPSSLNPNPLPPPYLPSPKTLEPHSPSRRDSDNEKNTISAPDPL